MKKLFLFLICVCSISVVQAQKTAITETGEEVILYSDGTWKLKNGETKAAVIAVNPKKFVKPVTSTFLLKSTKLNIGVWIDSKTWTFKKAASNEDAEYEFQLKDGDLYGMMITEKVEIPLETLKEIALENGRAVSPDITIVKEEYRTVNNVKVLMLQMNGTIQGVKFTYFGYYYSNANGTVQFLTYTSQNLFATYKVKSEDLLNGFVEIK
ncbi:hypothetical protein [Cytophaga hutchinsonii]|jgi:hypothetical protein|uniref:Uncharacterized protein n=1 Tax=Cytophaga hutchinsonii (strain ATCC 33406 / DSM 1761 / CIP 103989 / NBRC 15051 / NCIMB 9469 / D465) TaxID=269798 RepID=A0A6N4SRZ0_CYTH3|nr:hypothetical protein [Cytophaga hutchinsonii]ABG59122.1 hypothetical protein CHU_1856 [Cytophaga hutchinsonii ATCC 33406]SFX36263.1 hypothetical protein SAMN04487930_103186 [Cytophaga hutchinsonii ATCC 33406]